MNTSNCRVDCVEVVCKYLCKSSLCYTQLPFFLFFQIFVHSHFLDDVIKTRNPGIPLLLTACTHPVDAMISHDHSASFIQLTTLHHILVSALIDVINFKLPRPVRISMQNSHINIIEWNYTFRHIFSSMLEIIETAITQDKPSSFPILPRTTLLDKPTLFVG